jgi:hypothetical protein
MSISYRLSVLALVMASSASAQDPGRAEIVRGLCRPDGCDEFAIISKQPVEESDHGILFRTRVRTFLSNTQGRSDQGEEDGYVFCSALSPAILSEQNGQTVAFLLAPYARREARENTNFYTLYFAMCHGTEAGRAAARDWRAVAGSLNYNVPLAQSRTVTLNEPREVIDIPVR